MKLIKRHEKIECPLLQRKILEMECTDIILIAENLHPERFAPEEIRAVPGWKDICCACKNNPYSKENEA